MPKTPEGIGGDFPEVSQDQLGIFRTVARNQMKAFAALRLNGDLASYTVLWAPSRGHTKSLRFRSYFATTLPELSVTTGSNRKFDRLTPPLNP